MKLSTVINCITARVESIGKLSTIINIITALVIVQIVATLIRIYYDIKALL